MYNTTALKEGIAELFGILSTSHAWLHSRDLVNKTNDDADEIKMIPLMISALDVLPRMSYYLTADKWRIDLIENNTFDNDKIVSTWWQYR